MYTKILVALNDEMYLNSPPPPQLIYNMNEILARIDETYVSEATGLCTFLDKWSFFSLP